jgi:hypothetical protein
MRSVSPAASLLSIAAGFTLVPAATTAAAARMFSAPRPYTTGDGPSAVAIADVNGDRKPDVVTANAEGKTISVLLNAGRRRFRAHRDSPLTTAPHSLKLVDVDGDGKRDVVTAAPIQRGVAAGSLSILLNDAQRSFRLQQIYPICSSGLQFGTGDMNDDGRVDVVAANPACFWGFFSSIFLNAGNGLFERSAICGGGAGKVAVAIGDVDTDGKPDLVTASVDADTISVGLNGGDVTRCPGTRVSDEFQTGRAPLALALRDLNGDGKRDVVTANYEAGTLSVLLNKGDGTFAVHVEYPTGGPPTSVAVGDLNGDHMPDIATTSSSAGAVSVRVNRGRGTFGPRHDYRTNGGHPSSVAIADLNSDGRPDLAVANEDTDNVSVFFNRTHSASR